MVGGVEIGFIALLLLVPWTAVDGQDSFTCDWNNDVCPYQFDDMCDDEMSNCTNVDCFDCDPLRSYRYDCPGCIEAGGYWCPGDAMCLSAPIGMDFFGNTFLGNGVARINSCPTESDWRQDCQPASPDNVFGDPLYDAMAWDYRLINVEEVWRQGITGKGVRVRVTDDGVDGDHAEFAGRFDAENSCPNYMPAVDDYHGTACASIIGAAGDNDMCAVGIAPGVTISACHQGNDIEGEAERFLYKLDAVDISSNSWGPVPCFYAIEDDDLLGVDDDDDAASVRKKRRPGRRLQCMFTYEHDESPCNICGDVMDLNNIDCQQSIILHCYMYYDLDPVACLEYLDLFVDCRFHHLELSLQETLHRAVLEGRNGKGVIFTFPAGNEKEQGSDGNLDGYVNSRLTIAVGAVDQNGKRTSYTTPGAPVLVTAPSGDDEFMSNQITAKSGGGCEDAGVGTSYSTPTVAGVVALMLEANPDLTWRDVQGVLAESSQYNDPEDAFWMTNAAGFHHNYFYGFGLVDAAAAVSLSQTWVSWGPEQQIMASSGILDLPIADMGTNATGTSSVITVSADSHRNLSNVVMESVVVYVDVVHGSRGDLTIVLTSPSGTESIMAPGKRPENTQLEQEEYWKLMTVRNWGESPFGDWTLEIEDEKAGVMSECADFAFYYPGNYEEDDDIVNGTDFLEDDNATGTGDFMMNWTEDGTDGFLGNETYGRRTESLDEWWDCPDLELRGHCAGGAVVDDFVYQVQIQKENGVNLTAAEACCACGGGVQAEDLSHVLKSWRLVAYGHLKVALEADSSEAVEKSRKSATEARVQKDDEPLKGSEITAAGTSSAVAEEDFGGFWLVSGATVAFSGTSLLALFLFGSLLPLFGERFI